MSEEMKDAKERVLAKYPKAYSRKHVQEEATRTVTCWVIYMPQPGYEKDCVVLLSGGWSPTEAAAWIDATSKLPVSAPTPAAEPADENPYASDIDHLDVAPTPAAEEDGFEKWWSARGGHSGASEFRKECAREAYNARPFTFTHYGHETTLDIETAQRLYAENLKQIEALTAELEQRKLFPSQLIVQGGPVVTLAAFDEMKAKLTAERDAGVEKGIRMARTAYESHYHAALWTEVEGTPVLTHGCSRCDGVLTDDRHLRMGESRESRIAALDPKSPQPEEVKHGE